MEKMWVKSDMLAEKKRLKPLMPADKYAACRPGQKIKIGNFVFKIKFFDVSTGRLNMKFLGEVRDA